MSENAAPAEVQRCETGYMNGDSNI